MLKEMRYFASQKLLFIKPLIEPRVLTAKCLRSSFALISFFVFCPRIFLVGIYIIPIEIRIK